MALCGWTPALNDGTFRRAPATPTLAAIREETSPFLDSFVDKLFCLDSACTPKLVQGGRLRPLAECMLATELMYYEFSVTKFGEAHPVTNAMLSKAVAMNIAKTRQGASNLFVRWGAAVRAEWESANVAVADDGSAWETLCGLVTTLTANMALQNEGLKREVKSLHSKMDAVTAEMGSVKQELLSMQGLLRDFMHVFHSDSSSPRKRQATGPASDVGSGVMPALSVPLPAGKYTTTVTPILRLHPPPHLNRLHYCSSV